MEQIDKIIEVWQPEVIQGKLAELNRRARRLGLAEVTATIVKQNQRKDDIDPGIIYITYDMRIVGPMLCLNGGWTFVGKIDHYEGMNLAAPGQTIPAQYRNAEAVCQHCGKDRDRKETYIFVNAAGEYKQVGSSCLLDFVGIDPSKALWASDMWYMMLKITEEDEEYIGGKREPAGINLERFLAQTFVTIRVMGWLSRKEAEIQQRMATASIVWRDMTEVRDYKWIIKERFSPADLALAQQVVAWMLALDPAPDNDYLFNLLRIAQNGFVTYKSSGFAASAVNTWQREQEKIEKAKHNASQWVGQPGAKIEVKAKLLRTFTFHSEWGVTHKHKFVMETGAVLIWSTATGLDEDCEYMITGKVQKVDAKHPFGGHVDYKGEKQTLLSRPKLTQLTFPKPVEPEAEDITADEADELFASPVEYWNERAAELKATPGTSWSDNPFDD